MLEEYITVYADARAFALYLCKVHKPYRASSWVPTESNVTRRYAAGN